MGFFSNLFSSKEQISEGEAVERFLIAMLDGFHQHWHAMIGSREIESLLLSDKDFLNRAHLEVSLGRVYIEQKLLEQYAGEKQTERLKGHILEQLDDRTEGDIARNYWREFEDMPEEFIGVSWHVAYVIYKDIHRKRYWGANPGSYTEPKPGEMNQSIVTAIVELTTPSEPFWERMLREYDVTPR